MLQKVKINKMSDYTVIEDISKTLLSLLRDNINGLIPTDLISLDSPADVIENTDPRLSLYLYQITENHHLKNQKIQSSDVRRLKYPPLPLYLFYLLTAYASSRETEQQIIGRATQIFYNNSIIRGSQLQGSLSGTFEDLTVVLHHLPIEDLHNLWNMFGNKPYKLSLTYRVSPALIDSTREIECERIISLDLNYHSTQ